MNKVYVSVCILVFSLVISSCGIQEENKIAIRTYPDNIFYLMFGPPSPFVISANDGKKVAHDISYINLDGVNFAWSPDGQWVVYNRQVKYIGGNRNYAQLEIFMTNTKTGYDLQITNNQNSTGNSNKPKWSPDGTTISYWSDSEQIFSLDVSCIIYYQENCQLTPRFIVSGINPDWSPDKQRLVYEHGDSIYVVESNGIIKPEKLANSDNCNSPKWSQKKQNEILVNCAIGGISIIDIYENRISNLKIAGYNALWSPDGEKVVFISNQYDGLGAPIGWEKCHAEALFFLDIQSGEIQRLTRENNECILWYALIP